MQSARRESDQRRVQQAGLSLLGLAFDGVGSACSSPRYVSPRAASPVAFDGSFVEGVDPQLFLEGVKEHAKYLGIDPEYDAEYLWIAKESLVAPMPTGWHQVVTKDGAPYYYNDHTGESRWEHPSDRDYMALFQEIKRRETLGERVDAYALKHQWFNHGYEESWGVYEESVGSPSYSYAGDRTMEYSESELDDETPFQYEVTTKKKSSKIGPSAEEHKKLIETLYGDINQQKQQIAELQQALLDAQNKQLHDKKSNTKEFEATIADLNDALKQSQQQVIVATAEVELVKSKAAQENLDLREQVTTLQTRVKEFELKDKAKKKCERERLERQITALQENCNELKRELESKCKLVAEAEAEIKSLKHNQELQLNSKANEDHANELQEAVNAIKKQHKAEIDNLVQDHAQAMENANADIQARKLDIEKLLGVLEADKKDHQIKYRLKFSITKYKAKCKKLENGITEKETTFATMTAELKASRSNINEQLSKAREEGQKEAYKEAESRVAAAIAEKDQLAALYNQEMKARRQLHNKLMEMAGNIRVFCRVRPIQPVELKSEGSTEAVHFRPNDTQLLDLTVAEGQKHSFEFDYVFQNSHDAHKMIVCIFAYGQTGSGKTHTMEGSSSDRGVNFRAMEELFRVRDERLLSGNMEYDMKLSILEVYNETIVDLLDGTQTSGERKALEVRMGKHGAFVENLMEVEVNTISDVEDLMKLGHSHRSVGGHDFNEHSSRSHLVLSMTITAIQKSDGKKAMSKLHLIDLAGSERISKTAASGQRLKEAQHINRSLSALGDVIASLGGNSKHVPYRNSKLTFLLQESLSGNSKVLTFHQG
ncbi:kinesin [Thraustotheca clavata]|uniref:Kinesin-like protein n=1 Tax=Thraustotheca clavata TaxID=74557 RepID=A0A1V9ZD91_9STRA|nr:kinesin [Thraustotheca clavata]